MRTALEHRQAFCKTLILVRESFGRIRTNSGTSKSLRFPDLHKLTEGLFLSGWTYWEGFCRDVLIYDLATDGRGKLRSEISNFRTKNAPIRLAARMLNHPDHPEKCVDWSDYKTVRDRANEFLAAGHRFTVLARSADVANLKRIRNAVAHRSDKAWEGFRSLVTSAPFSLGGRQLRGITPGDLPPWIEPVSITRGALARDRPCTLAEA